MGDWRTCHPDTHVMTFSPDTFLQELRDELKSNRLVLPTLPNIATEALLVIDDPNSSGQDLGRVIGKDAAVTARLIRYANSAAIGGITPVKAIQPAITRIGFARVKNAVYAISMQDVFRSSVHELEQEMKNLWEHSVRTAAIAAELALTYTELPPDVAMVAGLTHDVGKIPIIVKATREPELIENPPLLQAVLRRIHSSLGASILRRWNFAPELVTVALEHEDLVMQRGNEPVDLLDVVQLANILSHRGNRHPYNHINLRKVPAVKRLGLTVQDDVPLIDMERVEDNVQSML